MSVGSMFLHMNGRTVPLPPKLPLFLRAQEKVGGGEPKKTDNNAASLRFVFAAAEWIAAEEWIVKGNRLPTHGGQRLAPI